MKKLFKFCFPFLSAGSQRGWRQGEGVLVREGLRLSTLVETWRALSRELKRHLTLFLFFKF